MLSFKKRAQPNSIGFYNVRRKATLTILCRLQRYLRILLSAFRIPEWYFEWDVRIKRNPKLQEELFTSDIPIDLARVISSFNNSPVPLAHAFSSAFLCSSWNIFEGCVSWDSNDTLPDVIKYIGCWRGRVISIPEKKVIGTNTIKPFLDYDASIVSIKKQEGLEINNSTYEITGANCSICPHKGAFKSSLFLGNKLRKKNVVAQNVAYLIQSTGVGSAGIKSYNAIMKFVQEKNQLQS